MLFPPASRARLSGGARGTTYLPRTMFLCPSEEVGGEHLADRFRLKRAFSGEQLHAPAPFRRGSSRQGPAGRPKEKKSLRRSRLWGRGAGEGGAAVRALAAAQGSYSHWPVNHVLLEHVIHLLTEKKYRIQVDFERPWYQYEQQNTCSTPILLGFCTAAHPANGALPLYYQSSA